MDLNTDAIYAGIAGVRMTSERAELGHGLVLSQTFAHFMAPYLMAFGPAESGQPHPGPWSAVSGGIALDIHVQLYIPADFNITPFFDRLNTVWWIAALIRLRCASHAHVPVIADRAFSDVPNNWKDAVIFPIEVLPRVVHGEATLIQLSSDDIHWLESVWIAGARLMDNSAIFNDAFQALDSAGSMSTRAVALLAVWGALEHLFAPAKQELRFRVSANIAAYLEPPGRQRLDLHKRIMKLYDARSSVAHGTKLEMPEAWPETYALANRILTKMLTTGHIPSRDDLDSELFSPYGPG